MLLISGKFEYLNQAVRIVTEAGIEDFHNEFSKFSGEYAPRALQRWRRGGCPQFSPGLPNHHRLQFTMTLFQELLVL